VRQFLNYFDVPMFMEQCNQSASNNYDGFELS
jgi:hypothetical protein